MPSQTEHKSYLVRFQRGQGQLHWRATLQDVRSEQVIHFESEQELVRMLLLFLSSRLVSEDAPTTEV